MAIDNYLTKITPRYILGYINYLITLNVELYTKNGFHYEKTYSTVFISFYTVFWLL